MGEWKEYKLTEVADFKTGKLNSNAAVKNGLYPFFTCSPETLSIDEFAFDTKAILLAGNNAEGNFAIKYYDGKFNAYQRTYVITGKNNKVADLKYLFYSIKSQLQEFKNISIGSATRFLTMQIFDGFILNLPPFTEQKSIASILSSLDDKIDLLHRQNATLEKLAETLFRQWFVEEAKEEWENCVLEDLCSQINSGGTPSTKIETYYNGNINWYSTKELNDNYLFESISKITQDGLENSAAKLFPKGTVLIAIYAAPTVGRLGILGNQSAFNQAACGLIANDKICCKEFIYLYLKNQRNELNAMASGSAQQNLNVGKIKTYPAFIPDDITMNKFKREIIPFFEKIEKNAMQIRTIKALRDTLLPKLMSGEVRVDQD